MSHVPSYLLLLLVALVMVAGALPTKRTAEEEEPDVPVSQYILDEYNKYLRNEVFAPLNAQANTIRSLENVSPGTPPN